MWIPWVSGTCLTRVIPACNGCMQCGKAALGHSTCLQSCFHMSRRTQAVVEMICCDKTPRYFILTVFTTVGLWCNFLELCLHTFAWPQSTRRHLARPGPDFETLSDRLWRHCCCDPRQCFTCFSLVSFGALCHEEPLEWSWWSISILLNSLH